MKSAAENLPNVSAEIDRDSETDGIQYSTLVYAPEAVDALRAAGKGVAFVTNDVRHSGEEFVRKWVNILSSGGNVVHRPLREPTAAEGTLRGVEIPPPAAIDYYGMIDTRSGPVEIGAARARA